MHIFGEQAKPIILQNIITDNNGPGIVTDIANSSIISQNTIENNDVGIITINSNCTIKMNLILKNKRDGVQTFADNGYQSYFNSALLPS